MTFAPSIACYFTTVSLRNRKKISDLKVLGGYYFLYFSHYRYLLLLFFFLLK